MENDKWKMVRSLPLAVLLRKRVSTPYTVISSLRPSRCVMYHRATNPYKRVVLLCVLCGEKIATEDTEGHRGNCMNNLLNLPLAEVDPLIANAIDNEVAREANGLELIASENFVSEAVLEAMGSVFTNKYAEGYPGKRYYGGCEWTDVVEQAAIDRAKELFGADHANVQPHSGAQRS